MEVRPWSSPTMLQSVSHKFGLFEVFFSFFLNTKTALNKLMCTIATPQKSIQIIIYKNKVVCCDYGLESALSL